MWQVDNPVGRLITARWSEMRTVEAARAYRKAVLDLNSKLGMSIVCADWSRGSVMPPDVAPEMLSALSSTNSHVLRAALLLAPEHATFNLQAERLVRDAKNAARRVFRDREQLLTWLGELMTPSEAKAARAYLE